MEIQPKTIVDVLKKQECSQKPGLLIENNKKTLRSWNHVIRASIECAFSLIDVRKNESKETYPSVIICMENCMEAFEICYGCHLSGLIVIVVSPRIPYEQIKTIVDENNVKACFIDSYQRYKFERLEDINLPRIIVGVTKTSSAIFQSYGDFIERKDETEEELESRRIQLQEISSQIYEDDICEIVLIPSEEGGLKPICWTHKNVLSQCMSLQSLFDFTAKEKYLHFFPHYFFIERIYAFYLGLIQQFTVHITTSEILRGKGYDFFSLMRKVNPTLLLGVPRLYQKIVTELKQDQGRRKRWSKKVMYASTVKKIETGGKTTGFRRARNIQKKGKQRVGILKVKRFFNAISPIERPLMCELLSYGIIVYDGLCLPETTGYCCINQEGNYMMETLGSPIGNDIYISFDHQRIIVQGPIVIRERLINKMKNKIKQLQQEPISNDSSNDNSKNETSESNSDISTESSSESSSTSKSNHKSKHENDDHTHDSEKDSNDSNNEKENESEAKSDSITSNELTTTTETEDLIYTDQNMIITQYEGIGERQHDQLYVRRIGTTIPLITTSTGQIVYPLSIEKRLNQMKTITASLVIGNNQKFLGCFLFTSMPLIKQELKENTPSRRNVSKDPFYAGFLKRQLEEINMGLSKATRLKRFVVIVDPQLHSLFTDIEQRKGICNKYEEYVTIMYKW